MPREPPLLKPIFSVGSTTQLNSLSVRFGVRTSINRKAPTVATTPFLLNFRCAKLILAWLEAAQFRLCKRLGVSGARSR